MTTIPEGWKAADGQDLKRALIDMLRFYGIKPSLAIDFVRELEQSGWALQELAASPAAPEGATVPHRLAPLCEEHGTGPGTRATCPYCALQKLSAALSRIDYLCGPPNDMGISGYDCHYSEEAVVAAVELRLAAPPAQTPAPPQKDLLGGQGGRSPEAPGTQRHSSVADQQPHIASKDCWCEPYQDSREPTVWIHRGRH